MRGPVPCTPLPVVMLQKGRARRAQEATDALAGRRAQAAAQAAASGVDPDEIELTSPQSRARMRIEHAAAAAARGEGAEAALAPGAMPALDAARARLEDAELLRTGAPPGAAGGRGERGHRGLGDRRAAVHG